MISKCNGALDELLNKYLSGLQVLVLVFMAQFKRDLAFKNKPIRNLILWPSVSIAVKLYF